MRQRGWWIACSVVAWLGVLSESVPADVVYVEGTIANTVGAVSGAQDWFSGDDGSTGGTPSSGGSAADDLWRFRTGQGSGEGIWEATSSSTGAEDAAMIRTTIADAPIGTYDVYVFYRSEGDPDNWNIRAGLSPESLTLYDRAGTDGIAGERVFSGTTPLLDFFLGTEPIEDTGQPLYYAILGQATVTDGTLSVYIDDFPTSSLSENFLEKRSWYDGIGYFTTAELTYIDSVMSGLTSSGSTWSNSQPPAAGSNYRVVSGHTVTVDSAFVGDRLEVSDGGVLDFNSGGSGAHIPVLIVHPGASLTETVGGDFALGDISQPALGTLQLDADVNFSIDAGANFFLDMSLSGTGNLDFDGGAGSHLWLSATQAHEGVIRFNGAGDTVRITENQDFATLEMNSTGANTLFLSPLVQTGGGTVIFNEPGTIDHASTSVSPTRRLHGADIAANAAVTVDLTKGFPDSGSPSDERRFLVGNGGLEGSADVTVNGMSFDPTGGAVSLNEFEVGSTGEPSGDVATSPYAGTLTANDFVNVELRNNFPNAAFVINENARLEMGHQAVPNEKAIAFGEVTVNGGGTLEVGFEQALGSPAGGYTTGHHAYHLDVTNRGGRSGGLTLNDSANLQLQINGLAPEQFDSIAAIGDVALDGTLHVLMNPPATSGATGSADNPIYTPTVGDTFNIIEIANVSPVGDFDGNGTVDEIDYALWNSLFGTNDAAADGNGNGVVDAADYVLWRKNVGQMGGTIGEVTGTFDEVQINDPLGTFAGFGLQVNYSPTLVQLEVVAAGAGALAAVPEPATLMLLGMLLPLLAARRRSSLLS